MSSGAMRMKAFGTKPPPRRLPPWPAGDAARIEVKADDQSEAGGAGAFRKLRRLAALPVRCSCSALQTLGGGVNGRANADIGGAAAQIAVHGQIDVLIGRLRLISRSSATADMICPDWQ